MGTINTGIAEWQDLSAGQSLPASYWNKVKNDIVEVINGAIDEANVENAGLLPEDMNGTAMTLTGGAAQTGTQTTTWNGRWIFGAEVRLSEVELWNGIANNTPSVDGKNFVVINNSTGGAVNTVTGLNDGEDGQMVILAVCGAHQVTLLHGTDTGDFYFWSGSDVVYDPAAGDEEEAIILIYTNLDGLLTNKVWFEVARRALS